MAVLLLTRRRTGKRFEARPSFESACFDEIIVFYEPEAFYAAAVLLFPWEIDCLVVDFSSVMCEECNPYEVVKKIPGSHALIVHNDPRAQTAFSRGISKAAYWFTRNKENGSCTNEKTIFDFERYCRVIDGFMSDG